MAPASAPSSPRSRPDVTVLTESLLPVGHLPQFVQDIINKYLIRAGEITDKLIDLYTQLAFDKGSELRVRMETFENVMADPSKNITTARELATASARPFTIKCIETQGEIDGLILALQHCDRVINHWHALERL